VRIAVEQRSRYLEDLLLAYTDAELLDPKQVDAWPTQWAPAHYFRPLNSQALYAAPQWLMGLKIFAHRILEDRLDLIPAGSGPPIVRTIGGGKYEHQPLQPWTAGVHEQRFTTVPGRDQVLWLDWGGTPGDTVRHVSIRSSRAGSPPWLSRVVDGNGLQAILLQGRDVDGDQALLSVASSAPVPGRPLFQVVDASQPQRFTFDKDRRVSLNRLLPGFDDKQLDDAPCSWTAGRWKTFRAPALHSDAGGGWSVCFRGSINSPAPLQLRIRRRDGTESVREMTAADGACPIEMEGGETLDVRLESSQAPPRGQWLVEHVSFEYRPSGVRGR
jgi:hypothetical protein